MIEVPTWLAAVVAAGMLAAFGFALRWAGRVNERLIVIETADREISGLRAKSHRLSNEVARLLTVAGIDPSDGGAE